jgi:hypothetical protein
MKLWQATQPARHFQEYKSKHLSGSTENPDWHRNVFNFSWI